MTERSETYVGFRIEEAKLELLLLAHELYTGARIARHHGIEYYKSRTSWVYACTNFVSCPFSLRVRKYNSAYNFVFLDLRAPHYHSEMKSDTRRHYPCAISRFITTYRNLAACEVKRRLYLFVQQALDSEDVIGNLHRARFRNCTLGRISGYVYEELFPPELLIANRIRKYNKAESQINGASGAQKQADDVVDLPNEFLYWDFDPHFY